MESAKKLPDILDLKLFDSCMTFGTFTHTGCHERITRENVINVLDRYGIAEALVHEPHARAIHPRNDGNRRLLESIEGLPRLHPVWVIEPPRQTGPRHAKKAVDELLEAKVRAARLPMKALPPFLFVWEDLLSELESHRLPCFCDFGGVSTVGAMSDNDVRGIYEIEQAHPDLPLIMSGVMGGLGVHPAVPPLVRRVSNVMMDIAGIMDFWRKIAVEVNPEKILFSTGAPFTDPGLFIANIQYDHLLNDDAKRLICGGNLRNLMEAVQ